MTKLRTFIFALTYFFISIIILSPKIVLATDAVGTTIKGIDVVDCWNSTLTCVVIVTSTPEAAPCKGLDWRTTQEYVFQSDENQFKYYLATFLSIYYSKSTVSISGKGTCGVYGAEKISVIRIEDTTK